MIHTEIIIASLLLPPMLILSGLVSGSETALFGISHPARSRLAHVSPIAANALDALLRYPRHVLTALLALNMLINVSYFSISSILVVGLERDGATALAAALGVGSLIAMILVGEIAAKLFANAQTVAFCRVVAPLWIFVVRVGWPLWNNLDRLVLRPLVRLASAKPTTPDAPSAEDLAAVLTAADTASDQESAAKDQRLLAQIINLRTRRVRNAIRPRVEIPTLPSDTKADRLGEIFDEHDTALITDHAGRPQGWLDAVPYLHAKTSQESPDIQSLLDEPLFIPELASLDSALRQLRKHAKDRAVVVDERGELEGIIFIEDIVATLLEHAADQTTDAQSQPQLVALGVFSIPGRWPAEALLQDLDLDHDQVDHLLSKVSTVGGLVLALLGKVPDQADTVELPGATITVTETAGRVVLRVEVRFHNVAPQPSPNPESTSR